jgi:putative intracellular protease/amidase
MRRVAIIPSIVGYHWEEVYDAYFEFKKAGFIIDFFTVKGKPALADPKSLEERPLLSYFGLGLRNSYSPETDLGKELQYRLTNEINPLQDLFIEIYDAIYIPGGHGCLMDVTINPVLHEKLLQAFYQEKLIAAVCHGSSALAFANDNGIPIIQGKRIIGFPDILDKLLLSFNWIHPKFLPLPYWNEQKIREAGAVISWLDVFWGLLNPTYFLVDAPFITGMGPKAAQNVAKSTIKLAKEKNIQKNAPALV